MENRIVFSVNRELRRVPLDFSWPLDQVWKGYINPYRSMECKTCAGSGLNPATKKLDDDWYTHYRTDGQEGWMYHLEQEDVQALIDAGRLMDFTRVPINEEQRKIVEEKIANGGNRWLPFNNGYIPTAEEVNTWAREIGNGIKHDSTNRYICVKSRAERLGVYGDCPYCKGNGELWQSDEIKRLYDEWQPFEPPLGNGFQLWETTSEGSPMSPVFESLDELCEWATDNETVFGSSKISKDQWMSILDNSVITFIEE